MALGKSGLGKGLEALFPSNVDVNNLSQSNRNKKVEDGIIELKLTEIEPDVNQPRKTFDDEKIQKCKYEDTKSYQITKLFLTSKELILRELLDKYNK